MGTDQTVEDQRRIDRAVIEFARMWNAAWTVDGRHPIDIVVPFIYADHKDATQQLFLSQVLGTILRMANELEGFRRAQDQLTFDQLEGFKEDQRRFGHQVAARMDATKKEG